MGSIAACAHEVQSPLSQHPRSASVFSDSVFRLLDRIDVRRADSSEDREAISRLRYQAYLREGAISANSSGTFFDAYDKTDNAYLFGLYLNGELASSVRLHVASREHPDFPSLEVFSDVLGPELDAGKVIIDSTRFVADENLSRQYRGLPYATVRLGWMAAEYFNAYHLLAPVRTEHQAFYRRVFGHRLVCEPRPYPRLAKPICLMTVHFSSAADQLYRRYPFFHSTLFERRMLFERTAPNAKQPAPVANLSSYVGREPKRLAG
jgi:N-acyl-L-homoserine lactone synthetase